LKQKGGWISVKLCAALAAHYGVPAITQSRDFPMAGGLMSDRGDFTQSHRRTASMSDVSTGLVRKEHKPDPGMT